MPEKNDHGFDGVNYVISTESGGRFTQLLVPKYPGETAAVNAARWSREVMLSAHWGTWAMRALLAAVVAQLLFLSFFAWETVDHWMVVLGMVCLAALVSTLRTARIARVASDAHVFRRRVGILPGAVAYNETLERFTEKLKWVRAAAHKGVLSPELEAELADDLRVNLQESWKPSRKKADLATATDYLVASVEAHGLNMSRPVPAA